MKNPGFGTCVLVAAVLAGCGGGGDGGGTPPAPTPPVQGVFTGTLSGATASTAFQMLALENGDVWAMYGTQSGNLFLVRGFIQGPTTISGSSFSSASAKDYGVNPPLSGTMTGTITAASVNGSVQAGGAVVNFAGTALSGSTYDYNTPANLALITGSWSLQGLDGSITTVNVAANGSFTGNSSGCLVSGTITPRASGKNVFDVSVTSGGAPCVAPGSTSTGIAVTYLISGTSSRQLIVAGTNAAKTAGLALFGTR